MRLRSNDTWCPSIELTRLLKPPNSVSMAGAVWIGTEMDRFSNEKNSGVIDAPCGGESSEGFGQNEGLVIFRRVSEAQPDRTPRAD